jgi:hypothetical protein
MTLWEDRETGRDGPALISLAQYESERSGADALNEHADRVLAELPAARQGLAGSIFRALTDVREGREVKPSKIESQCSSG